MKRENIRNFCIISHIDHGKSTLADRMLEMTKTISDQKMEDQVLDQMDLEKEKGITIKMQPVRMLYNNYTLNLIDTPGHMDFSYEVERALQATEGALLLVSAKEGIQTQTLANLRLAKKQNLKIIPVINKIDLNQAEPEKRAKEVNNLLDNLNIDAKDPLFISAKTGENVDRVLQKIVKTIPEPPEQNHNKLRTLVFDSVYDNYKGVIAFVRVFSGSLKPHEDIKFYHQDLQEENLEVGIFQPNLKKTEKLQEGEIGWVATGIKESSQLRIGETITKPGLEIEPIEGYRKAQPVVFANLFPDQQDDFTGLKKALEKLKLNDPALDPQNISHATMGRGVKLGVLGMLHLEVTLERLKREFNTEVKVTPPSVSYKVKYEEGKKEKTKKCLSPADFPHHGKIKKVEEPIAKVDVISPVDIQSKVHKLVQNSRGNFINSEMLSAKRMNMTFKIPLAEIMTNFQDQLKSISQGFASFSYEIEGYEASDLVKMEILVAGEPKSGLAKIVHKDKAQKVARKELKKLKDLLPQQNFAQKLQAQVKGNIIAREDIPARRKDVTEGLYGGDYSRKKKLLKNQREQKKKMKKEGQVEIPKEVYQKMIGK
ncbi:MAG: translation elongation factor 4 [Candidatus Paceibacterota bacterium]